VAGTTYHFAATAYDANRNESGFSNDASVAVPGAAPVAAFSAGITAGFAPLAVNFVNSSTGSIASYFWTFGDGTTSTAAAPSHVYSAVGSYNVSLLVSGPNGSNTQTRSSYVTVLAPPTAAGVNYQGLWWNAPAGSESGWGINLAHQGDTIFASWFTYDRHGRGWWLVMTARKIDPSTYQGQLFETTGPPFGAVPFDPAQVQAMAVGMGTLSFTDADNGTFSYTIDKEGTITQAKAITRQVFGPQPACTFGVQQNLALATNYQGLWWNAPAGSESGWGVNFSHQGATVFLTWFTYDVDGTPMWLVATAVRTAKPLEYVGTLYRTLGARFDAFNPADVVQVPVGEARLTFINGNVATFAYSVDGMGPNPVTQSKWITRQIFAPPGTACQ